MKNTIIENKQQLIDYFKQGIKPEEKWAIGTEHEKFVFKTETLSPVSYEEEGGIRDILKAFEAYSWDPFYENDNIIGLKKSDGSSITLEPAGQFELSGAPLKTLHETCREVHGHLNQVKEIGEKFGVGMFGMGFTPTWSREDVSWMPKPRYGIMKNYMPKKGNLGLDMMLRTCTIQTNLDFGSEEDMVKKFRVAMALQPVAMALFANSPFTEGKPNGYLSYRTAIWDDTDPDRCGYLEFVFDNDFGFEAYIDYALSVPMYFVKRDGQYIDASGQSFQDFLNGNLPALTGEKPMISDWEDHLTTIFADVRLKHFIEVRGADGGAWRQICALPALWVGLLYDETSLNQIYDLVMSWSKEDRHLLRQNVAKQGLKTKFGNHLFAEIVKQVLDISKEGLVRRAQGSEFEKDETHFLNALYQTLENEKTPAEDKLDSYFNEWKEDIRPLFKEHAY